MIKLVAFDKEHAKKTLEWVNDPELMLMMNRVNYVTESQHWEWYEKIIRESKIFAIIANGKHIGNCCLKDINTDGRSRKAELWIYIGDPTARGKGYGKKATQLLLDYAFKSLNLHRVYLYVMNYNQKAFKMYKKIGFKKEGVKREDIFINGRYHDAIIMGILKKEWAAKASGKK